MGTEPAVDKAPAPTEAAERTRTPRFTKHRLGTSWLIALAVIPFLLAVVGYWAYGRPTSFAGPSGNVPTLEPTSGPSSTPGPPLSLLSISRSGNTITLIGDFPDENSKAALMASMKSMVTPGVNVIDQIRIDPLVHSLDFSNAEPIFFAAASMPEFTLKAESYTVNLTGTAISPEQKDAVERAATRAWSTVDVTSKIQVKGQPPVTVPAIPGAPPSPGSTPPPPGAAGACANLQATINAVTGGPIYFAGDGVTLTSVDDQILTQVADKLKACPDARVTVNGYTDNAGAEGINIPLSDQRARAVADFLIAHGVPRDHVTAKGLGSVNPIGSNDTPEGRIKNRRAEIVVG
ncbi:hypothetical protein BST27_10930 [Mycobacterium intermedium]|uniref:OmpA-like domain-containing protein n=2 Tax=Mycobacterium intermedium TaxID=28445 RepID=A0A1E3S9D3_MYCIE|nr:hypothetical protein BHQ20_20850 [Mycobacterium intermedium]OPE50865.1 hypothetical protein BV508_08670 [Mycobacterium intermedium]ORB06601.1 hypothetical protein BST27_10930 [Mycobacterium intermedium]